ncbi:MAG: hypothetical protein LAT55_13025 [Opitutales bacterium]|nr:hypothetical protein [Opitutales bacterium]
MKTIFQTSRFTVEAPEAPKNGYRLYVRSDQSSVTFRDNEAHGIATAFEEIQQLFIPGKTWVAVERGEALCTSLLNQRGDGMLQSLGEQRRDGMTTIYESADYKVESFATEYGLAIRITGPEVVVDITGIRAKGVAQIIKDAQAQKKDVNGLIRAIYQTYR